MKTIGAAVFLIFSAHWAFASEFDLPTLKYDRRDPGSLTSAPASGIKSSRALSVGSDAKLTASGGVIQFGVKVEPITMGQEKTAGIVSGGLPPSRALELTGDHNFSRAAREYFLISRQPLKAELRSESPSLMP